MILAKITAAFMHNFSNNLFIPLALGLYINLGPSTYYETALSQKAFGDLIVTESLQFRGSKNYILKHFLSPNSIKFDLKNTSLSVICIVSKVHESARIYNPTCALVWVSQSPKRAVGVRLSPNRRGQMV